MSLLFVTWLKQFKNFNVIEPGIVRQQLLTLRVIMPEGVSLADADALFSSLDADLILTGDVFRYQDYQGIWGKPKVDFSAVFFDRQRRTIMWSSESYNEGDDGVFFFDRGRINTAHAMASRMVQSIAWMIIQ